MAHESPDESGGCNAASALVKTVCDAGEKITLSGEWNVVECAGGKPNGDRFTLNLKESATSYESVGTGWCIDDSKAGLLQRQLPALYKKGARPAELKALCDKYQDCVAVDWDNNELGHLRFSSATALNAVDEPGWGKWSDGCNDGCVVKTAGDGGQGKCHVKRDVSQARYYLLGPGAEPHAFVTFDGKTATYVDPTTTGALLPNGDIQWSLDGAKWCFRKDAGKPCKECEAGKTSAAGATTCEACPAGKVSAAGSAQGCVACEAGKYVAQTDGATKAACDACPAGKTAPVGSDACMDMPAPAPTDTPIVVSVTVTMPYTKAAFEAHKDKYRAGVASAAGVNTADVVIVSVVEVASRRAGGKVQVETEIRAADAAASGKISSTLGTGAALKSKLTESLQAQGLEAPEAVSDPVKKEETGSSDLGAIIGGAAGGGVVLLGSIAAAVMCMRKNKPVQQAASMQHPRLSNQPPATPTVVVEAPQPPAQALQLPVQAIQPAVQVLQPDGWQPAQPQQQLPPPASMGFCEQCGSRVQLGAFCSNCGTKSV